MERLYQAISELPVQIPSVRRLLETGRYTPQDLTNVLLRFIDHFCRYETQDFIAETGRLPHPHELHCGALFELTALFLRHGLNPNLIVHQTTVLMNACTVDSAYTAADVVRLLLEHGGDPNLAVDGESAFDLIDFDVIFGAVEQEDRRLYDSWVHTWLVMIGYGGVPGNGVHPLKFKAGHNYTQLREHERFDFEIETTNADPDGFIIHIFDRTTKEEFAVL